MDELMSALRGSTLLARGIEGGNEILHFLLPTGQVLEIVRSL